MPVWHARFEQGDEYITVDVGAETRELALAACERQNQRLAFTHSRRPYRLVTLERVGKPTMREWVDKWLHY